MHILIVEDEKHIADGLAFNLEAENFEVTVVETGEAALDAIAASKFDAIVLDVMLPGIDGFTVAESLRAKQDYTPILMLTARGRPEDVLRGFEAGTDDYLPKPFELAIFLARLNGLLRRADWSGERLARRKSDAVTINGRMLDLANLELHTAEGVNRLTLMEAKLLRYLIDHEGNAVSRKTILEEVWGLAEDTDTRAIDNFIVRLRKYLEDDPANPQIVVTVRGIGYKFVQSK
jgi:two-component system, OmpR family, alkaline phosphatase synthesis response regulator PhoP